MNNISIKEYNNKIAKFMGLTPDSLGFYLGTDIRKLGIPFPQYMGNGTTDLQFHTSYDWLMPVLEKIERELGFYLTFAPYQPEDKLSSSYCVIFKNEHMLLNDQYYVRVFALNNHLETLSIAVALLLAKYYSQKETILRIAQKQATMRSNINKHLVAMWSQIGCDNPSNADDIIDYIYDDICDTLEEINSGTVATGFRRWIEAQQKCYYD